MRLLSAFVLLFCAHLAFAGDFTYDDLVQLIQSRKITSLEALLPLLPESLRSNYTLMRESHSIQSATDQNPRAILFGKDAKLTCAFNGDPDEAGYDVLECFQFRQDQRKFDFRQIEFPTATNGLNQVVFSEENRTANGKVSCTGCHGSDPRPNWASYAVWPGAYGEQDDDLEASAPVYENFVKIRPTNARYKWLIQGTDRDAPYMGSVNIEHRPNLRFSDLVGRMNGLRAERIMKSKVASWEELGFDLRVLSCPVSDDLKTQFTKAGLDFDTDTDPDRIFQKIGLPCYKWSTQPYNGINEPACTGYEHQSGFGYLSLDIAMVLVNDLAAAGDQPFKDAIAKVLADYKSGDTKNLLLFNQMNSIYPSLDRFSDNEWSEVEMICPELTRLFTREYMNGN